MPLGFAVIGGGNLFEHAGDVRILERELLRPTAVLCGEFTFLHAAFATPDGSARIAYADRETSAYFPRGDRFHRLADGRARPDARTFRRSVGQELAETL